MQFNNLIRTITIGDLHGLNSWKVVDPGKYEKIIFLGDYFDSLKVRDDEMVQNFIEIIEFKQEWFDRVILIIGNHEMSYLNPEYRSSGYRSTIGSLVESMLWSYLELFKVAWQYKNYLWSHAGVEQSFYEKHIASRILDGDKTIANTLQRLFEAEYPPIFEVGYERGGAYNNVGGPLWIDAERLLASPLKGYHQIVGHNPCRTILHHTPFPDDHETSVTLCDCIERGDGKLYEIEITS